MTAVYLSLGSNLGDRIGRLQSAVDALQAEGIHVARVSRVYETAPQGGPAQGWFLNIVAEARTGLFPLQLLSRVQAIERRFKRSRSAQNGPRTIDIDIIFYGNAVVNSAALQIPHPRYSLRRFVLAPLLELAPDLQDPSTQKPVRELLGAVKDQPVRVSPHSIVLVSRSAKVADPK